MDSTKEKTISRVKSPYIKQLISFVALTACVAGLAWFDGHLIVDMPDLRAFNIFLKIYFLVVLVVAVTIVYLIDERRLKKHDLYPQDFVEQDEREEQLTGRAARRSFIIMDFIFLVGSLLAMAGAAVSKSGELRLLGVTFLVLYIIMHAVFLLTLRKGQAGLHVKD